MNVSVILCTFNRCESLRTALQSVAVSQLPDSVSWEVLVVDNNSKDDTRHVVDEFARRYPGRFRYLSEPQQGKSYALNSGIRESFGEILAFMDDDVAVDSNWLRILTSIFHDPQWAGAGGRILPERSFTPPPWLSIQSKYALAPLAIFDIGSQSGEMREAPFGTNMAFRREVFEKVGGFRTDLGPRPGSETRSEDTEFGYRALGAGQRLWYEPSALVYHSLSPHRLQQKYFLAWWYDKARADIRAYGVPAHHKFFVAGIPLRLFRGLVNWAIRWITSINPAQRFSCKIKVWMKLGEISECYRLASRAKNHDQQNVAETHPAANSIKH
jgi:glycosyltransferase involved in cell wall biosynthesis